MSKKAKQHKVKPFKMTVHDAGWLLDHGARPFLNVANYYERAEYMKISVERAKEILSHYSDPWCKLKAKFTDGILYLG